MALALAGLLTLSACGKNEKSAAAPGCSEQKKLDMFSEGSHS